MKEHCFVQSFDHQILEEFELICVANFYKTRTIYLHNFYNHIGLPPIEVILKQGDGINISVNHISKELVQIFRQHGKIVSVWVDSDVTYESENLHRDIL